MTSPIDAWNAHYALDRVRLPASFDDLEVICCLSEMRVISHVGIELLNCKFNNPALQQIRRRMPVESGVRVKVRFNTASMRRIWVTDPMTGEHFEVLNQDPDTRDLSAEQVAALERIRRQAQSQGVILNRAQARRRMAEHYKQLTVAMTQAARRRALKLLGFLEDPSASPEKPRKKTTRNNKAPAMPSSSVDSSSRWPSTSFQPAVLPIGESSALNRGFVVPQFKTSADRDRAAGSDTSRDADEAF